MAWSSWQWDAHPKTSFGELAESSPSTSSDWSHWKGSPSKAEFQACERTASSTASTARHWRERHKSWQDQENWGLHNTWDNVDSEAQRWQSSRHVKWSQHNGGHAEVHVTQESYGWHWQQTGGWADDEARHEKAPSECANDVRRNSWEQLAKTKVAPIAPARFAKDAFNPMVLVLGMPKCGTTSLHNAFISAGLISVHWALDAGKDSGADKRLRERSENADQRLIALLMQRAVSEKLPPLAFLPPGINAVAEMNGLTWAVDESGRKTGEVHGCFPQMSYLEDLARHYPHAHFILNTRDPWKWVRSVESHNDMRRRLISADLHGLPRGCGHDDDEIVSWVQSHHARVMQLLGESRLLVFDIEHHGEQELSSFLGRKVSWGHYNQTA